MKLLTRAELNDEQYQALRDAPHFVAVAVASAAGSFVDEMRERAAANLAIADGVNSEHPVIREIAGTDDVKDAERAVRAAVFARDAGHRGATDLEQLAVRSVRRAMDILSDRGTAVDRAAYGAFVLKVARSVSEAAREGDVLGLGGAQVGPAERAVILAIEGALADAAGVR
jgi:hypothetical protein